MSIYFGIAFVYFLYRILKSKDKQREVLTATAYFMGAEVYLRMTKALILYETGKYVVILFFLIGMFYQGFKQKSFTYVVYFLLLIPAIIVSYVSLDYETDFRQMILFNLSGPLCLTIGAVYCYDREIQLSSLLRVLNYIVYPIVAMTLYVFLYNPDLREVVTSTASTSATSGGYGPNQVATMFGLGMFILFSRLLLPFKDKLVQIVMMVILLAMSYRALVTFSRGGVITSIIIIGVFTVVLYFLSGIKNKVKISFKVLAVVGAVFMIWGYALVQTSGLINNRYSNKDALGREKADITTGRSQLISADFEAFQTHPVFGLGLGQVKLYYQEKLSIDIPSHNEVSRMLSEHGSFGFLALLILLVAPLINKFQGRQNIYFYPFILFWLLTILHSSMRIAAPAVIYAFSLLNVINGKPKPRLHR